MSKIDIPLVVVIPQIITAIYLRFSSATNSGSCSRLLPESNCFQVLGHPVDTTEVAKKNSNIVNDLLFKAGAGVPPIFPSFAQMSKVLQGNVCAVAAGVCHFTAAPKVRNFSLMELLVLIMIQRISSTVS